MSFPSRSVALAMVEMVVDGVFSAVYLTLGVVHHIQTKGSVCLLYFLTAAAAAVQGCVKGIKVRERVIHRRPLAGPES